MPIYEYYCEKCKKKFDKTVSWSDIRYAEGHGIDFAIHSVCPICYKWCKRLPSTFMFGFKGGNPTPKFYGGKKKE